MIQMKCCMYLVWPQNNSLVSYRQKLNNNNNNNDDNNNNNNNNNDNNNNNNNDNNDNNTDKKLYCTVSLNACPMQNYICTNILSRKSTYKKKRKIHMMISNI